MRLFAASLLLSACAMSQAPNEADDSPPLSSYEHVFRGAPANGSLPDIGKADATYPAKSTDLLQYQSPVKDQQRRGVCTIFTTTGLMEHLYIKAGASNPSFSEQYLQWAVKSQAGVDPNSEGSNISDNVTAIHQFGIVTETDDPYRGTEWTAADDPQCSPDGTETQQLPMKCWTQGDPSATAMAAKKWFLPAGHFINSTDIKSHITSEHTAVGVGIDFFYQAWGHRLSKLPIDHQWMHQGIVRYPNADDITSSHTQRAGHGILIIGWDDTMEVQSVDKDGNLVVDASGKPVMQKGFYLFKNSWGTTVFGDQNPTGAGYGWIAEQYIQDFGTAYVVSTLPDPNGGTPPTQASCQYKCSDFGFSANECSDGWQCDADGACMSMAPGGTCSMGSGT
jgi:C1A family cysteine protease